MDYSCCAPTRRWVARVAAAGLLALLVLLRPTAGRAQPVLYNNYNHLPTGDVAALQGGGFIARADDASASWYNPAGLVRAPRDAVSGNASLYSFNEVSFDSGSTAADYSTTPTFIGTVQRSGGGPGATRAWGFSIVTPLDFQHASKRSFRQTYTVEGTVVDDVNTVLTNTSRASAFAPGLAWGRSTGASSSIGYGVRLYQFNLETSTSSIFFQDPDAGSPRFSAVENIAFAMEATLARLEAGWQTRLSDSLWMGAVVRSATAKLRTRGRVLTNFQQSLDSGGGNKTSTFASADNDDVEVRYRLPWELGVGMAWVQPQWELELDATYYRGFERYEVTPPFDVLVIFQPSAGASIQTTVQEPGVELEGRSFVNVALGGRVRTGAATWFNAGVYTDRAPGTVGGSELFTEVDFAGLTLGVTRERETSSTSLGAVYVTGATDEPFEATPGIVPTPARTVEVEYRDLALILAGSLSF